MKKQEELGKVAIKGQYMKDLSFENPKAPKIYTEIKELPQIDLSLNVNARALEKNLYEVELNITAKAHIQDTQIFLIDLTYSGIFELIGIEAAQKEAILLIYCPSIIFPFARRIISDVSRDGGFQPLMIDPIDFAGLYQQKRADEEQNNSSNTISKKLNWTNRI